MSAHNQQYFESVADWRALYNPAATGGGGYNDPGQGVAIGGDRVDSIELNIGSATETQMVIAEPTKPGLTVTISCVANGGGTRKIRTTSGAYLAAGGTNNTIQFTGVDQTIQLFSVRTTTNSLDTTKPPVTGFRWDLVYNNGTTLSHT